MLLREPWEDLVFGEDSPGPQHDDNLLLQKSYPMTEMLIFCGVMSQQSFVGLSWASRQVPTSIFTFSFVGVIGMSRDVTRFHETF